MNPNSTLTSSSSTNHIRRVLQALPYPPSDERVTTLKTSSSIDLLISSSSPLGHRLAKFGGKKDKARVKDMEKDKRNQDASALRRRKVEHWVPPIWIPDSKTSSCMRCGRMFGWRRRRHHCRLCGRCVCASCSGRVSAVIMAFYIAIDDACACRLSSLQRRPPRINIPVNLLGHARLVTKPFSRLLTLVRAESKQKVQTNIIVITLTPSPLCLVYHRGCRCQHYQCNISPSR